MALNKGKSSSSGRYPISMGVCPELVYGVDDSTCCWCNKTLIVVVVRLRSLGEESSNFLRSSVGIWNPDFLWLNLVVFDLVGVHGVLLFWSIGWGYGRVACLGNCLPTMSSSFLVQFSVLVLAVSHSGSSNAMIIRIRGGFLLGRFSCSRCYRLNGCNDNRKATPEESEKRGQSSVGTTGTWHRNLALVVDGPALY